MRAIHDLSLTSHAAARMQQRGIRAQALEALLEQAAVAALAGQRDGPAFV